jgi:ABC-2 type transport system permease protein
MNAPINKPAQEIHMIKQLVIKDWQMYQKQFAAYVVGLLVGLTLIGVGKSWAFYAGGLLLLVLLICVGGFAIQTSLLNERKEQTLPFMMSLPITPMTFFWSKVLANMTIYLVPFTIVAAGTAFLVLFTPLPDGILVWSLLIYGLLAMNFFISLGVALVMESEGWNIFVQIAVSTLISPFMIALGQIDAINAKIRTNEIVWSQPALIIFAAQLAVMVLSLVIARAVYRRKDSFV